MTGIRLSAVVISQNSAAVIGRCLESLTFADEIIVVDALSHDGTPDIARRYGARVVSNRWPGFAAQRRLSIEQSKGEWVFRCDTDEEVPEALAREIRETIAKSNARDGYRLRRQNQFLGKWILVGPWANDVETRLYRRDRVAITDQAVHEGEIVDGTVGELTNRLYHYAHPTISESIARLNRYTTLEAADRASRRRIHLYDAVLGPAGVFINYYITKGCWRAGVHGFLLSAITAMYKSVLYIKIYLLQRSSSAAAREFPRSSDAS
ncbi:MAG: glycosyltransferase family 2 protein [bacterium]